MKKFIILLLFILAAVGFVLSLIVHGSTFLGLITVTNFPGVFLLHIGIFLIAITSVLFLKPKDKNGDIFNNAMNKMPPFAAKVSGFLFIYIFFNFFFTIFVLNKGGQVADINGQLCLHSHGRVIKTLTPEEADRHRAYEVRTFSGHWIFFYFFLSTGLAYALAEEMEGPKTG
jgi:hypothetical protein